jgi:carboxyl-terminal processing protease
MSQPKQGKKVIVALIMVLGLLVSGVIGAVVSRSLGADRDLDLFWEAWKLVKENHQGDLPDQQHLDWGAIRGALGTLNDPCAALVEPVTSQLTEQDLTGRYGGIGAYWTRGEDGYLIVEPIAGEPAERAGVQKGDTLLKVDSTEITPEMTDDQVVGMIRGKVGTTVRLALRRPGESEPYTVEIVREEVSLSSGEWRMLDQAQGIGYIWFWIFSQESGNELDKALEELRAQGMERLVLDLRTNSGGDLTGGITVAAGFLPGGVIGYEAHKDGTETTWDSGTAGPFATGQMAILIDGGTASLAELVAGTLREKGRAVLVGEKTRGCASVQLRYELRDGSSLYLRYADLLTANRSQITAQGLAPDFLVSITEEDRSLGRDRQLDRAIQYLTTGQ